MTNKIAKLPKLKLTIVKEFAAWDLSFLIV
jgi:hypothetical protein